MNGDLFPEVAPTPDENRRYTTRELMAYVKRVARVDRFDLDPDADLESHHAPRYFVAPGDMHRWASKPGSQFVVDAYEHPGCSYLAGIGQVCTKCARLMPSGVDSLAQSWLPPAPLNEWRDPDTRENRWRIFVNPPFDAIGARVEKVWATIEQTQPWAVRGGDGRPRAAPFVPLVVAMVLPGNRGEQPFWQEHVEPYLEGHEKAGRYGYALTVHHPPGRQAYGYPGNPLGIGSAAATPWPTIVLHWRRS